MKYLQLFLVLILAILSFGAASKTVQYKMPIDIISDIQQIKVIHITDNKKLNFTFKDNGYSNWLKKQKSQRYFYQSSLEINNLQYVKEWNKRVNNSSFNSELYTQQINYKLHSKVHYGMNVNYQLFMFFNYFEEKHEILLERS